MSTANRTMCRSPRASIVVAALLAVSTNACVLRWDWGLVARDGSADASDVANDFVDNDSADIVADALDTPADASADACGGANPCCSGTFRQGDACVPMQSCDGGTHCGVVWVPARTTPFTMGDDPTTQQTVAALSAFWMDAYEVTVSRFRSFWDARASATLTSVHYPNGTDLTFGAGPTLMAPGTSEANALCNFSETSHTRDEHPMNCVDWDVALAFCAWDGGRLPTEAEYEYFARWFPSDPTPRDYPWGTTPPSGCDRAQYDVNIADAGCPGANGAVTQPVAHFLPSNGAYDLAGNVAEWMADHMDPFSNRAGGCWPGHTSADPLCTYDVAAHDGGFAVGYFATRGGSWATTAFYLRSAVRNFAVQQPDPSVVERSGPAIGFRCVHDP